MGLIPMDLFFSIKRRKEKNPKDFQNYLRKPILLAWSISAFQSRIRALWGSRLMEVWDTWVLQSQARHPDSSASATAGTRTLHQLVLVLWLSRPLSSGGLLHLAGTTTTEGWCSRYPPVTWHSQKASSGTGTAVCS